MTITLYGDALDKCPIIPSGVAHIHWELKDPEKATGTEEEILAKFGNKRELIKERVQTLK